jgi:site-specific recombinase XerD
VYQPLGLHEAEVHALLRVAGASPHGLSRRNYALVQLLVHTGVRVSEVAALSVGNLRVNRTKVHKVSQRFKCHI